MPEFYYKLTIAYDGTNYYGWQVQPNGLSIQEVIQNTMKIILRHPTKIVGSGRTDTGVHALGQVAHFHSPIAIDLHRFISSTNGLLPPDIRLLKIEEVDATFHARYSAIGKTYHYHLWTAPVIFPFQRLYHWHCRDRLDIPLLQKAAVCFIGTHDFKAFANSSHEGTASYDSVRTLSRLDVIEQQGGFRLEFEGNGFLYKMVRNIVGTLVEVARGKMSIEKIPAIIESQDRKKAASAAPALGLFLIEVRYPSL